MFCITIIKISTNTTIVNTYIIITNIIITDIRPVIINVIRIIITTIIISKCFVLKPTEDEIMNLDESFHGESAYCTTTERESKSTENSIRESIWSKAIGRL